MHAWNVGDVVAIERQYATETNTNNLLLSWLVLGGMASGFVLLWLFVVYFLLDGVGLLNRSENWYVVGLIVALVLGLGTMHTFYVLVSEQPGTDEAAPPQENRFEWVEERRATGRALKRVPVDPNYAVSIPGKAHWVTMEAEFHTDKATIDLQILRKKLSDDGRILLHWIFEFIVVGSAGEDGTPGLGFTRARWANRKMGDAHELGLRHRRCGQVRHAKVCNILLSRCAARRGKTIRLTRNVDDSLAMFCLSRGDQGQFVWQPETLEHVKSIEDLLRIADSDS